MLEVATPLHVCVKTLEVMVCKNNPLRFKASKRRSHLCRVRSNLRMQLTEGCIKGQLHHYCSVGTGAKVGPADYQLFHVTIKTGSRLILNSSTFVVKL